MSKVYAILTHIQLMPGQMMGYLQLKSDVMRVLTAAADMILYDNKRGPDIQQHRRLDTGSISVY